MSPHLITYCTYINLFVILRTSSAKFFHSNFDKFDESESAPPVVAGRWLPHAVLCGGVPAHGKRRRVDFGGQQRPSQAASDRRPPVGHVVPATSHGTQQRGIHQSALQHRHHDNNWRSDSLQPHSLIDKYHS